MDPEVQAFRDAMAEKAAAKAKAMAAVGTMDWETVAKEGINGNEGKAMTKAQKIADDYVKSHPDKFANVAAYVTPDGLEKIVNLISIMQNAGLEDAAVELVMFELASFERQTIGATPKATVRLGNGG